MKSPLKVRLSNWAHLYGGGLLDVIYPRQCVVCKRPLVLAEKHICLSCLADMPQTQLHLKDFNTIHQRLAPHKVARAAALFYYLRDNAYASIIHLTKYNNAPWIGRDIAAEYARELLPQGFFEGINMIIPVPLSIGKKIKRGYNQATEIAFGISHVAHIPVNEHILLARRHSTQTRKNLFQRYLNVSTGYRAIPGQDLDDKHILLIDDVITTGATMIGCIKALRAIYPAITISVLALAATRLR